MAADPNPTLTAELVAARAVLSPQEEGLAEFERMEVSSDLSAKLQEVHAARAHRDALLQAALRKKDEYVAALDDLEADGYPALPNVMVPNSLLSELQEKEAFLKAAVAVFEQERTIGIGAPAFTPQPAPTKPGP